MCSVGAMHFLVLFAQISHRKRHAHLFLHLAISLYFNQDLQIQTDIINTDDALGCRVHMEAPLSDCCRQNHCVKVFCWSRLKWLDVQCDSCFTDKAVAHWLFAQCARWKGFCVIPLWKCPWYCSVDMNVSDDFLSGCYLSWPFTAVTCRTDWSQEWLSNNHFLDWNTLVNQNLHLKSAPELCFF